MLKLSSISKTYTRGRHSITALSDASLEVKRGEFVGVFGSSRSGKTTLLRIAAGLEGPDSGSVMYDGKEVSSMSERELTSWRRKSLGCVWTRQQQLLGLNVIEAVAFPLLLETGNRQASYEAARKLLLAVEADQCADAAMNELSDGELRRVAIAQAIVHRPKLLLVDEPTAHLGPIERDSILELLQSLAREANLAVLITGTEPLEILRVHAVISIHRGKLLKADSTEKLGDLIEFPENISN